MGNYWYSTEVIEEKALQSYCVNSYANDNSNNLVIDYIKRNEDNELVIYYKVIENYLP